MDLRKQEDYKNKTKLDMLDYFLNEFENDMKNNFQ